MAGNQFSGRHKDPKTVIKMLNIKLEANIEAILDAMIERAIAGDKDMQIRLYNQYVGLPRQTIDANISGHITLSPDQQLLVSRVPPIIIEGNVVDVPQLPSGELPESSQDTSNTDDVSPDGDARDTDKDDLAST